VSHRLDATFDADEASDATGPLVDLPQPDLCHWLVARLQPPGSIHTIIILVDVSYAAQQVHRIVNVALFSRYRIYIFLRKEGSLSCLRLT
jgi:hypothetical protein